MGGSEAERRQSPVEARLSGDGRVEAEQERVKHQSECEALRKVSYGLTFILLVISTIQDNLWDPYMTYCIISGTFFFYPQGKLKNNDGA